MFGDIRDTFSDLEGRSEKPFTGVSATDCKLEFVRLAQAEGANRRELCRRFEVSPTLGYRLLSRYAAEGEAGLAERSRRPRGSPSPSTVTQTLRRHGVELGGFGGGAAPFIRFEHAAPNDLWQMDFKGYVSLDGRSGRLHPLTVLDDHSRFCLVLAACGDQEHPTVKSSLIKALQRYGLPRRITADNGPPWGAGMKGPGVERTWTALGVWLLEQDIALGHSRPFHPQTQTQTQAQAQAQGKDELFHRTVKAEALSGPPFADLETAARHLSAWRTAYNTHPRTCA